MVQDVKKWAEQILEPNSSQKKIRDLKAKKIKEIKLPVFFFTRLSILYLYLYSLCIIYTFFHLFALLYFCIK